MLSYQSSQEAEPSFRLHFMRFVAKRSLLYQHLTPVRRNYLRNTAMQSPTHPLRHLQVRDPVPSDLECSHAVPPHHIRDIAQYLGIRDEELELYGDKKAKVRVDSASFPRILT